MEGSNSGVTVVGSDAPSDYHVAARTTENPTTQTVTSQVIVVSPTPATAVSAGAGAGLTALSVKKKRGRPRKYAPDGSVNVISPKPISSSAPSPVIDFSSSEKRGKIRPVGLVSKIHQQPKVDLETPGEWVSCSVGANFTPHIITVNTGEDVTMKVISFSQQGPRAICILSANGIISSVTLRQPDSSGGTLTYEGRFEILSLTGSFMPSETGGMRNRSGGMSVSLASPDGRVVGGGVAGLLVAASPVQIVIGSFLAGDQHEQRTKKNKPEPIIAAVPLPETEDPYHSSVKQTTPTSSSFRVDNWSAPDSRNKPAEINMVGEVEKMVTVGLVWGATNALMRKGAIKWDETIKSLPQPNTPQNKVMTSLKNWFKLLLIWQYSLPFVVNLSASATFFAILSDTPISLAVPVTNATTFAATAVFGLILGEEILVSRALFGTFLIVLGVYICIM